MRLGEIVSVAYAPLRKDNRERAAASERHLGRWLHLPLGYEGPQAVSRSEEALVGGRPGGNRKKQAS